MSAAYKALPVTGWNGNIEGPFCIVAENGRVVRDGLSAPDASSLAAEMSASLAIGLAMGKLMADIFKGASK